MASFKPTRIQTYPKLGEKVTEDTLYWKNYKVCQLFFCLLFICLRVYLSSFNWSTFLISFSPFIHSGFDGSLCFFFQPALQIKEFGAVTKIEFSPLPPHNYAVTASTRVSPFIVIFLSLHIPTTLIFTCSSIYLF